MELSNCSILIVDDEPANIFVLEGVLVANNFNVISASNGKQALQLLKEEVPDLVMLDIMMPEMSGIDVLREINTNPVLAEVPILMVSARTEAEDIEGALNLGAVDYIPKPFSDVELLARVKSALRLKKQKDHLRELIESKNNFISIVSHDLRTPFSSISGFADILLHDEDLMKKMTSEHKEFLQYIIDTSHYLVDYFNKLLNWSRLEANRIELKKVSFKISRLIDTSQMIFQRNFDEKRIRFTRNIAEDFNMEADDTYFNQVINNLISNAIKYTPEGGEISINAYSKNDKIIIEVQDNGIGISGMTPEKLFNAPYHMSKPGTKNEKGSGIGLFICKKILDAHNFDITFECQPGKPGTTFIITCNKS